MFPFNSWYAAAEASELSGQPLGRVLLNQPVVLYRGESGAVVALEDRCCHRRAPLHRGRVLGDDIQCGYHGFQFDTSGACVRAPGSNQVPRDARVRSYPVRERHRLVWIWMGDPARADDSMIPDFRTNDDPAWAATSARLPVSADWLLLVDNLLDLSHVGFVHAGTIGSDDTSASLQWEHTDELVRGVRESFDIATPPHNLKQGFGPRSDQRKVMTFIPPGHITIDITTTERGDGTAGSRRSMHILLLNSITPETPASSHYFWASTRDFALSDPAVTEFFRHTTMQAFDEDKQIIEAQQRTIDLDPGAPMMSVRGDAGSLQARRLVARRIESERAAEVVAT